MTDLLEMAVATARSLPAEMQDEIARMVLMYAGDGAKPYLFSPEENAEQDAADLEESRGAYATSEEVSAIWKKHGL